MGNCQCQEDGESASVHNSLAMNEDLNAGWQRKVTPPDHSATSVKHVHAEEVLSDVPTATPEESQAEEAEDQCKDDQRESHMRESQVMWEFMRQTSALEEKDTMGRLASQPGFFIAFDQRSKKVIHRRLGSKRPANEVKDAVHANYMRIVSHEKFQASQVLGVFLSRESIEKDAQEAEALAMFISPDAMENHKGQTNLVKHLEKEKGIVSLMDIENTLLPTSRGVQLMEVADSFDGLLDVALASGVFGVKIRSRVKQPNAEGIKALVEQQFEVAKRIMGKGMVPVLAVDIDTKTSDKNQVSRQAALAERRKSEDMLFDQLLAALCGLHQDERVMFELMLPAKPNTYLSLVGHPNTVRVLAVPENQPFEDACKALEDNYGLVGAFGNVIMEGLDPDTQNAEEFSANLETMFQSLFQASTAVPTKEMQTTKVERGAGFFSCLDSTAKDIETALARYRLGSISDYSSDAEVMDKLHEMRTRIWSNSKFSGSRVIGVMMSLETMERRMGNKPTAKFLWEEKQIVPFLKVEVELRHEKEGVRLMKDIPKLGEVLKQAADAGIYGIRACSTIKKPNQKGIQAMISQHLSLSLKIMEKELVPVWHVEVEKDATDKLACEELLLTVLGRSLGRLRPEQKVILWVSPPARANLYLPLRGHPNVIRIVFWDKGSTNRSYSCKLLRQNYGVIGGFNRAFVEGMHYDQTPDELTALVDESSQSIFESSRNALPKTVQRYKVSKQRGFFVAFPQIGSRTDATIKATSRYGMSGKEGELEALFDRIAGNPQFNSLNVIGVTLTLEDVTRTLMGSHIPKYLWEEKDLVSFLKVDIKGLANEKQGVQLMQELPQKYHESVLATAVDEGCFGTTARSVIKRFDPKGVRELVDQQLKWAKLSMTKGLVPIVMISLDKAEIPDVEKCEYLLRQTLLNDLGKLEKQEMLVLSLTPPSSANVYEPFLTHPNVLRVLASDDGNSLDESCQILQENPGIVGNFGAALLEKLRKNQTYADFTKALGHTCALVHDSSRDIGLTEHRRGTKEDTATPRTPATPSKKK